MAPDETVWVTLNVVADTEAEGMNAVEVLSRVMTGLALAGASVNLHVSIEKVEVEDNSPQPGETPGEAG